MTPYSQRDPRWANHRINGTTQTLGQVGCVCTAMSMMADKQPDQSCDLLSTHGGFAKGTALIYWSAACSILGLVYQGSGTNAPAVYPCIACTDHFKPQGFPTHYFVMLDAQTILDPLDGQKKANPYHITNYQYIHPANTLSMDERTRLQQLEAFIADMQRGCVNEYLKPDGTIVQVVEYQNYGDYHDLMARDPKYLIQVPENFEDEVRALRTGGFQP